jgi:hypothetical protein
MLSFVRFKLGVRKLRLFTVACYRRVWDTLDDAAHQAVEVAERSAEERGQIAAQGLRAAKQDADAARHAAAWAVATAEHERAFQAELLRCIFGNPFRPVRIDASWLAWGLGTAVRLARSIYEERRWDEMPILGDALQEAGCTDTEVLDHCRGAGPHARGCFVVDLLLGKG